MVLGSRPRRAAIPTGMPHRQFIKLRYSEMLLANGLSQIGQAGYAQYRVNSLYDPQYASNLSTVSGHINNSQPMYRDQWANFYYQYRVYACKYYFTFTPTVPTTGLVTTPVTMVVYASDAPSTDTDVMITRQRIGARSVDSGGTLSSVNKLSLKFYTTCNRALGLTKRQYSDDKTTAGGMSSGSNPTTLVYVNILIQNMNEGTTLDGYFTVRMKFYCKLFDPIENIASS